MYAVIETGGKQYRVSPGDVIDVELLARADQADQGNDAIEFDRVLLVAGDDGVQVGGPLVEGASVKGTFVDEVKGPKIKVFKMKRRKGYRRTNGHRQHLSRVRIDDISL